MSDDNSAPVVEATPAPLPADAPETFSNAYEAARAMSRARNATSEAPAESADPATADEPELAQANADPATDPGTEPEVSEPEEEKLPPIERPRSWAKDLDEEWNSYPREAQEKIAKREQERDAAIRRSQNEAADERKAAKAERENAEKARQQYEAQLPALMQELQNAQQSSFADIRTVDDVTKLANEDPFRYLQWQAHQTKLQAVNAELERSKGEKSKAEQAAWAEYVQKENELAADLIPELADKDKAEKLTARVARELLPELGFKQDELNDLAAGKSKLSIYDHRIQRLLADGLKLRDIQNAKTTASAKPLPPVQRPGAAKPARADAGQKIQALQKQLDNASGLAAIRIAAELQKARRSA